MSKICGSEWTKWDLHIHTPASFFWSGSKILSEMTSEEKETEIKSFIDNINKSECSAFCLMDYWTFDWYFELQKFLIKNPDTLKKTIFPGMELRIECPVDYRLNIHCILSNNLSQQELIDFKSELSIRSIDKKLSDESLKIFAKSLDKSKAKKHGFEDPNTLNDKELIKLGSQTAEITKESLQNAFKQIPPDSGFIILPYDTSDGLLKLNWEEHPHDDNYYMQSAHIFETRDQKNIDLFNGRKNVSNEKYFDNFFKTLGNKSKPCISGSDAHKFSDYGNFPSNKITWIKADATFEGLKQIIYEPESRVCIQQDKPEKKNDYQVINKVRFLDTRTNKEFSEEWIYLNQNLNSIIGGKSSGKSLLLYHIAKTIDPDRINEINKDSEYRNIAYTQDDDPKFNFEIEWSDGKNYCLKDSTRPSRPITYIPQLYLNRLAEDKKDELNNLVEKMLIESNNEYKEFRDSMSNKSIEIKDNLNKSINEYFRIHDNLIHKQKELKELGDKKAIENTVKGIDENILALRKASAFTENEEKEYKDLIEKKLKIESNLVQQEKYLKSLNELQNKLRDYLLNFKNTLQIDVLDKIVRSDLTLSDDIKNSLNSIFDLVISDLINSGSDSIDKHFNLIKNEDEKKNKWLKGKEEFDNKLKPYQAKVSNKEMFSKLELQKKEEQIKLSAIIEKEKEIEELKKQKKQELFFKHYKELFNIYNEIIEKNSSFVEIPDTDNLKLSSSIHFNKNKFFDNFSRKISRKPTLSTQFEYVFDNEDNFIFSSENHISNIESIINKVLDEKVKLNSTNQIRDVIIALLEDYFYIDYNLIQDSDDLLKMSPGKRGIILFQLFLHLSKSSDPILIDQPEDNLDNRTVYKELNDFIKTKKSKRQIIIVSHNPNLVVSTDSENVIVANQEGQNKSGKNKKNKFEYINGSLENSFINDSEVGILYQKGIREHVCEILEGGKEAFAKREKKYGFT